MKPLLLWDDARIFLAIARHSTLSGAAIALEMGVATVSRRLDRLEAALAVPLFSRHMDNTHTARPSVQGRNQYAVGTLAAATSGLGLAVLPHYLARLADLVCLLPEMGADQPIGLVIHSDKALMFLSLNTTQIININDI